jgi:hypothetical protein
MDSTAPSLHSLFKVRMFHTLRESYSIRTTRDSVVGGGTLLQNPSGFIMVLGTPQPLIEMSNRNLPET